ncbi:hypothetical protein BIW11_06446 [Tropilaelaps mercedesae]|uniref:Uncharacterized protein n=1 Tax=Tropilaelaps mercedesae TaxID=418985 RepID=A0A1V9XY20_9ACAR|nr:hypothetical protein BIW11_06446 [Tropilaelaps mercedesae]
MGRQLLSPLQQTTSPSANANNSTSTAAAIAVPGACTPSANCRLASSPAPTPSPAGPAVEAGFTVVSATSPFLHTAVTPRERGSLRKLREQQLHDDNKRYTESSERASILTWALNMAFRTSIFEQWYPMKPHNSFSYIFQIPIPEYKHKEKRESKAITDDCVYV